MITQIQWDPRLQTQNQQLKINLSVSWTIHRACFFTWDHFDGAPRIPTRSSFLQLDLADSNGNPILRHLCTIDLMRELCPSLMATSPFAVAATHDIIENNIGPHLPEATISSNSSKAKTRSLRALASRYSSLQCRMNWATDFLIGHWTSGLSNAIQNNAKGSLWVSLMIRRWYDAWWWQFKATPSSRRSANSKPSGSAPSHPNRVRTINFAHVCEFDAIKPDISRLISFAFPQVIWESILQTLLVRTKAKWCVKGSCIRATMLRANHQTGLRMADIASCRQRPNRKRNSWYSSFDGSSNTWSVEQRTYWWLIDLSPTLSLKSWEIICIATAAAVT